MDVGSGTSSSSAFFRTQRMLPAVYFLGGYGQKPEDFEHLGSLLDALILTGQLQNMYFVFLPCDGGREGSFYVNQSIPQSQVPSIENPTSGCYEDSIIEDLIPAIERDVPERRVSRLAAPAAQKRGTSGSQLAGCWSKSVLASQ